MYVFLTVFNYPRFFFLPGLFSMFFFRLALFRSKKASFTKLMGSGANGSFDIWPDWNQWAIFTVTSMDPADIRSTDQHKLLTDLYGSFIASWCRWFRCETCIIGCGILEGHGSWDGKQFAERNLHKDETTGAIAVLTRATIRFSRLSAFWKNVGPINKKMPGTPGLIYSIGIGEMPLIRQATFSIWQSKKHMQSFAYSMQDHRDVITKTRNEKWYTEEMFLRMKPLFVLGTIKGKIPFAVMPASS